MTHREWMERAERRYWRLQARRGGTVVQIARRAGVHRSAVYRLTEAHGIEIEKQRRAYGNAQWQSLE